VEKKDITLKTALDAKEKEELELRPTSLTSMRKKTHYTRKAKPKEAG
jgi:hypothetical protein